MTTTVSLDTLIGLVSSVRTPIILDYKVDMNKGITFKDKDDGNIVDLQWVVPLMQYSPDGEVFESPRGAFLYSLRKGPENNPAYQGTGTATFELLPRMPRRADDIGFGGDIMPLVSIAAGKYIDGTGLYSHTTPLMPGKERMIHCLQLMPLVMDMLNRFAARLKTLPVNLDWREDVSERFAAA